MTNPHTDRFAALVRSNHKTRDSALLRATTELFALDMDHSREEIRRYEELAIHLLSKVSEADRIFVSGALAPICDAPTAVLRALARDSLAVAAPILKSSPALGSFDLLCTIAATGPDHHRLIAQRIPLAEEVRRALLVTGQTKATQEPQSVPDDPGDRERPEHPNRLTEPRVDASPQSPGDRQRAFGGGWDFLRLDRAERLRAVAQLSSLPPAGGPQGDEPRAAFAKVAGAAHVIGFARRGQISETIGAIADALDLPPDFVAAGVNDKTGEPLAILLRALRLDNAAAQQVILLTSPTGRDTASFFPLADLHAGMELHVAEGMIAQWRQTRSKTPGHQPVLQETGHQRADRSHAGHRSTAGDNVVERARRA